VSGTLLPSPHSDDEKRHDDTTETTWQSLLVVADLANTVLSSAAQPAVVVSKSTVDRPALARVGPGPVRPRDRGHSLSAKRDCSRSADRWTPQKVSTVCWLHAVRVLPEAPCPVSEGVREATTVKAVRTQRQWHPTSSSLKQKQTQSNSPMPLAWS